MLKMGPTELRVILILLGSLLALDLAPVIRVKGVPFGPIDWFGLVAVGLMVLVLSRRLVRNLRELSTLEPPNVLKNGRAESNTPERR